MRVIAKPVTQWIRSHLAALSTASVAVGVAFLAGHLVWTQERTLTKTKLLPPDTPPAEYLYLDSDRVLGYLGQVEGGLPESAKRILSEKLSASAAVKGGLIADVNGSAERQTSIEETVTPAATDRFFSLLIKLRSGSEERAGKTAAWLQTRSAVIDRADAKGIASQLGSLEEGDFVRLTDAHLYLPRFAALTPRARDAAQYSFGTFKRAPREPAVRNATRLQAQVSRYLKTLGPDPVLPFIIPTATSTGAATPLTFIAPARYSGLLDNARLLSGSLTVVGKVIYLDDRPQDDPVCQAKPSRDGLPCTYLDRQTVATYATAVERAPALVRRLLHIRRRHVIDDITTIMRFKSPLVVLLPVAIYQ